MTRKESSSSSSSKNDSTPRTLPAVPSGRFSRKKRSDTPAYAVFTSNGQQFGLFTQRGIRTEQYKYIWNLTDVDELYDLSVDPGEKHNLALDGGYDEVKKSLGEALFRELRRRRDPFANGWVGWQLGQ